MSTRTLTLTNTLHNLDGSAAANVPISVYLLTPDGIPVCDLEGHVLFSGAQLGGESATTDSTGAYSETVVYVGDLRTPAGGAVSCQLVVQEGSQITVSPAGFAYAANIAVSSWYGAPSGADTVTTMTLDARTVALLGLQGAQVGIDITASAITPSGAIVIAGEPVQATTDATGHLSVALVPSASLNPSTTAYMLSLPDGSIWYFTVPLTGPAAIDAHLTIVAPPGSVVIDAAGIRHDTAVAPVTGEPVATPATLHDDLLNLVYRLAHSGGGSAPVVGSYPAARAQAGPVDSVSLIDRLLAGTQSGSLTGDMMEFDLAYVPGQGYYSAWHDGSATSLKGPEPTIAALFAASNVGTVSDLYPSILFDGTIWHVYGWYPTTSHIRHWTCATWSGTYVVADTCVGIPAGAYDPQVRYCPIDGRYYLAYTTTGTPGKVGIAVASSLDGPWTDLGLVFATIGDPADCYDQFDPTPVFWNGRAYMLFAGGPTGATSNVRIVELDPSSGMQAIGATSLLVDGTASWQGGESDNPIWLAVPNQPGQERVYFVGATGSGYLQAGAVAGPPGPTGPTGPSGGGGGSITEVHSYLTADSGTISTSGYTSLTSATLAAGTWLIFGKAKLYNSGTAGNIVLVVTDGTQILTIDEGYIGAGLLGSLKGHAYMVLSTSSTVALEAQADAGSMVAGYIGYPGTPTQATGFTALRVA